MWLDRLGPSRLVSYKSLIVIGKYEAGLLPSGSGVAGRVGLGGGELFRAQ